VKSFRFLLAAAAAFMFGIGMASAQARRPAIPKLDDLPRIPIDTIATQCADTQIILYSNNTWSYYRPALMRYNDAEIFTRHWDTTQIFSYRSVELTDLPMVTELKLISSLSDFHPPITGRVLSKYGVRGRRSHNGVDIPLRVGDPVHAAFDGRVRYARFNTGGFGNMVIIRHHNGLETWYAHLTRNNVTAGDYVKAGQVIGFGGSTGRSRGAHLHFEMRYFDQSFDPEFIVDFESGNIRYQTFALERSFFNIRSRATDQLEEDDDFMDYAFAALENGEELTSEEIIARIESGAPRPQSRAASNANTGGEVYHTVVQNDMLSKLAVRYNVTVAQICRLNNITPETTLRLGRRLRIR